MVSKLRGGKRTVKEVKEFVNASYDENPPENIGDFILDKNLTTLTAKVYYNPQTREAVVIHRGTQGSTDWVNNLAYLSGTYETTDRYKQGKKVQDEAEKKYGAKNISTLSHSQGSVLARKLGANTKEIINLNPAYKGEQELPNEYNIRSKSDVVSGVLGVKQYLNPSKNVTTIESKSSFEPLGEHSPDILDRLEGEIGGLRNKISTNNMKRAGKLNYTGEDINWYDGGILPVSAYQNVGNFGVIGGGHYESESSESDSDEEMIGGDFFGSISNAFKPVSKAVTKTTQSIGKELQPVSSGISKATGKLSKVTDKINPMTYALKDKGVSKVMTQSGEVTNDYLLPAVVQAGKPVYDATAMTASTMLTGNPLLGKVAGDALWNTMAQPYDPRERQKSQILGEIASTAGKVLASQTKADLAEAVAEKGAEEASGKGRRGRKGGNVPRSAITDDMIRQTVLSYNASEQPHLNPYYRRIIYDKIMEMVSANPELRNTLTPDELLNNAINVINMGMYPRLQGRGKKGGMKKPKSLLDMSFDKLSASDKLAYLKEVNEGIRIPPSFPFQMSERQYLDNRTQYNRDKYPHLYEGVKRLDGTGRKKRGGRRKMKGGMNGEDESKEEGRLEETKEELFGEDESKEDDRRQPQRDERRREYRQDLYRRYREIPTRRLIEDYNRRDSGLTPEDGGLDIDEIEMLEMVIIERAERIRQARARLGRGGRRKMKGGAITDADVENAVLEYTDEPFPTEEGVLLFETMIATLQRDPRLRNTLTIGQLLDRALEIRRPKDIMKSKEQTKGGRKMKGGVREISVEERNHFEDIFDSKMGVFKSRYTPKKIAVAKKMILEEYLPNTRAGIELTPEIVTKLVVKAMTEM